MSSVAYQLIDFGDGRKLEALGDYLIDRPSPAAERSQRRLPRRWGEACARYDNDLNSWRFLEPFPADTHVDCGGFVMPVRPTPFGHLGLFPEQSSNWDWLSSGASAATVQPACNALNLFAYTGASTMALAKAGYHVAHVDAAKPNVDAARTAAACNGMTDAPIRYLVDDAAKFTAREVRRQRAYQTIVLDPPAYGHGPKGKTWRLERDLWPLLDDCLQLIQNHAFSESARDETRLLMTGHSPSVGIGEIETYLLNHPVLRSLPIEFQSKRSGLIDGSGRRLDTGFQVRATINIITL